MVIVIVIVDIDNDIDIYCYCCYPRSSTPDYLYFLVHLDQKKEDDYTSAENYVAELRKKGSTDYFPIGSSICLADWKSKLDE